MKSVLVTGATGFLGKHLIEKLKELEPETHVRAFSRSAQCDGRRDTVEVVRGDVKARDDVLRAVGGVEEIYHLAGVVSRDPRDKWSCYRTHIEGTQNICDAARQKGINKIVMVSTSGTIAVSQKPEVHDEGAGYKHDLVGEWPYYLSKIFAEKSALRYVGEYGVPLVVVNPSLLLGPGDDRNASTRDVVSFLQGQIPAVPLGGLSFVDVRDVATGLILAMRAGKVGERYLLSGPNWTFRQLMEALSEISGARVPKLQPSLSLSLWSARLLGLISRVWGKPYLLDEVSIKMSSLFWYCDSEKARVGLGFTTRDPMETLRDTTVDIRRRLRKNFE